MKTLGLTGGIGAGKSAVASLFLKKGIAVYNSDKEAKNLYTTDEEVKEKVLQLLGSEAYFEEEPNFRWIAEEVFNNEQQLQALNAIIHPAVKRDFDNWKKEQTSAFVVKEAAILFESGTFKQCDAILTVSADTDIRVERVMQRDHLTAKQVQDRISKQWPEERKIELSDFVLVNNSTLENLELEFNEVYPDIEFRMS